MSRALAIIAEVKRIDWRSVSANNLEVQGKRMGGKLRSGLQHIEVQTQRISFKDPRGVTFDVQQYDDHQMPVDMGERGGAAKNFQRIVHTSNDDLS